ncbi:ADP-ribosylglycohydrolase family protein [Streptomyces qinzhouensis]|uniref:ADP-ribosylglycohydrolase family protein n=1 Tax=Streptomyces qinzhouensis TaxID=2599401 RepID=A0A5B8JJX4_9ACTN|nr:ADP-ribosylglycohydrolase family protein [Streptomyces qinzhouensis]QDY80814.1 ADP-ribosylglycohydrolase family protein [Streptomyces qinzhouensis]
MTPPGRGGGGLRLTWVQPEDLVGHELRQASEDGREPAAVAAVAARWAAAGGTAAPPAAGASPAPAPPRLRELAGRLLDELAELADPRHGFAAHEPTELPAIRAACPDWPDRPASDGRPPAPAETTTAPAGVRGGRARPGPAPGSGYQDALHAAWLGRAAGCLLGKPVEKLPLAGIRALAAATGNWPLRTWFTAEGLPGELARAYPWNRRSAPTSLAETIDGMPEDDDLNYPLLNLLLLRRYGRGFRTRDVAALWLDELPAGRTFTAERVAYRNLLCGVEPPETARRRNPFREWIGAAIRADVHGWTHPGDPGAAAAQAHRDAALTHTANGVYGAMFVAATIAAAAGGHDDGHDNGHEHRDHREHRSGPTREAGGGITVHRALAAGLTVVPPESRLARAVRFGIAAARAEPSFDSVVDLLHRELGHYHWVHAVPNAALLAAALTHAEGDFSGSICRAVSGGWDTDSNGATAGSVAGLLAGHPDRLPERWTDPLRNRLASSVPGFDGIGFDALAQLTHQEALRP